VELGDDWMGNREGELFTNQAQQRKDIHAILKIRVANFMLQIKMQRKFCNAN
jgi:hypothetical protein